MKGNDVSSRRRRRPAQADRHHLFAWYVIRFFTVWTAYVWFVYPRVAALGLDSLAYALLNTSLKALIWVVPVFLYLRLIMGVPILADLKLRHRWRRGLLTGLVVGLVYGGSNVLRFGVPTLSQSHVTWNSILSTSIAVGVIEEIPFRGLILQQLQERYVFWLANAISSALFLLIHVPGWVKLGDAVSGNAVDRAGILIFGFVMAGTLRYSGSLWSCIVAHDINDFCSAVLF